MFVFTYTKMATFKHGTDGCWVYFHSEKIKKQVCHITADWVEWISKIYVTRGKFSKTVKKQYV